MTQDFTVYKVGCVINIIITNENLENVEKNPPYICRQM